jgi:hypothetical protein
MKPSTITFILFTLIIPINFFWDFISIFYTQRAGSLSFIRAVFILSLYLYFIRQVLQENKNNSVSKSILLFAIYIAILIPFSDNVYYSLNVSIKVLLSILMYPLGYALVNSESKFNLLVKRIPLIYLILVIGFALTNIFNLGGYDYSSNTGFQSGGLTDSWNNLTYAILLSPLLLFLKQIKPSKKFLYSILVLMVLIFLIISFKRIAISGLSLGVLIYFYYYGKLTTFFKMSVFIGIFLTLSFPIYKEIISIQYEARQDRFEDGWLEKEGRYMESFYVWEEVFEFNNPIKSWIGLQAFNSIENYANGFFGKRQLHVDYNLIINTTGIIGLFLYLRIFYTLFIMVLKIQKKSKVNNNIITKNYQKVLIAVAFVLVITPLYTSLGGQMYHLTFRSLIFLYLGGITRWLEVLQAQDSYKIANKR